jgi:hypothetical protein
VTEEAFYQVQLADGSVKIARDAMDQYRTLAETLSKRPSMAIQDDYDYWKSTGFQRHGGKLLLVDTSDTQTQHIFFDDNIGE